MSDNLNIKEMKDKFEEINLDLFPTFLPKLLSLLSFFSSNDKKGDGLSGGSIAEPFFREHFNGIEEYHNNESDFIFLKILKLSFKKITGKTKLALNWSKNQDDKRTVDNYFCYDMIILNLKGQKWWNKGPMKISKIDKTLYTKYIPMGIYFIDKNYCKKNITKLGKNNKSNSIIGDIDLYRLLKNSLENGLCIELKDSGKRYSWNFKCGFMELKDLEFDYKDDKLSDNESEKITSDDESDSDDNLYYQLDDQLDDQLDKIKNFTI